MKTLTIFTPAYNRAHTLSRTYESLLRQTCDDFEWLIVDDGSGDDCRQVLDQLALSDGIEVRYRSENGGKGAAGRFGAGELPDQASECVGGRQFGALRHGMVAQVRESVT